jgi:4-amino-4-deoxy-L-arabinose transferase-like glycosyltransferase
MALLCGVGIVVVLVGLTAIVSPPNTWDAMQYHMPRLVHWLEQRSVAFFATHDLRQLHMSPGAEYFRLQFHALSGADHLDNLIQWGAYVASVIGVTLIATSLGAGIRAQVLAAVIVAAIPQGILEASGSKNDWIVALWLVALTHYLLGFRRNPSTVTAAAVGATLGLAFVTKGTAYLFAPPLVAALAMTWPKDVRHAFLRRLPLIFVLVALLTGGHIIRNYSLYGSPFGPAAENPEGDYKYAADTFAVPAVLSTVLRNVGLHLGTPSDRANTVMTAALEGMIRVIGGDPNDPRTTWTDTRFRVPDFSRQESTAGNPVHLALIAMTLGLFLLARYRRSQAEAAACAAGLLIAFLAFCAVFRWQPWHSRLHLPLFVLWAAPISVALSRAAPRAALWCIGPLLLCLSIPFVLGNDSRPLAWPGEKSILRRSRTEMYFAERREVMASFLAAARAVRETGCQQIGLAATSGQHYEYPLLVLLRTGRPDTHVSLVGVGNRSAVYATGESWQEPCAVVCLSCAWNPNQRPNDYRRVWSDGRGQVYLRSPLATRPAARLPLSGSQVGLGQSGSLAARPTARLTLGGSQVRLGQSVTVGVSVSNPPDGPAAELLAGVILPDGRSARFLDASGALGPATALDGSSAFPPIQPAPPGFSLSNRAFAKFAFPMTDARGHYHVFIALLRQGAAARGQVDRSDIVTGQAREIVVTP